MTTEPLEQPPACRHQVAVAGGSLGCTLPLGHPGTVHTDEAITDYEGFPVSWSCQDRSDQAPPSVCKSWAEYVTTETG